MVKAKKKAKDVVQVELMTAQFPEDINMVPEEFVSTKNLDRSVLDLGNFERKMKLPILADILQRMYEESDADYLIYTNVDIGVYPDFYTTVNKFIDEGYDAFIINRRRIPAKYTRVEEISEIYQDFGKKHPGFDCFVFHRDLFPQLQLMNICIGVPFIGITLSQNLFALSSRFKLFTEEKLTFHIGMEIIKGRAPREYFKHNQREFWKVVNGPLRNQIRLKKLPYSNWWMPFRLIRWGIQPSFPIRLMLRLEYEHFKRFLRL